jgi:hypothetical protein
MADDPIKRMIREEIDRLLAEGYGVQLEELEAAVQARVYSLPPERVRDLLAESIRAQIESGRDSPGDTVARFFYSKPSKGREES